MNRLFAAASLTSRRTGGSKFLNEINAALRFQLLPPEQDLLSKYAFRPPRKLRKINGLQEAY